jgi:hypothetical protein
MQTYHYNPLENNEIRLLTLHTGNQESRVRCTLRHAQLPPEVQSSASLPHNKGLVSGFRVDKDESRAEAMYDAVSYCWGNQNDRVTISLDGSDFDVGGNLESALHHLRLSSIDRILWIDAICINQCDIKERGQQVLRMGKIYERALAVRVWLGPEEARSDEAMRWMADSPKGSLFETGTDMSNPEKIVDGPSSTSFRWLRRRIPSVESTSVDGFTSNARMIGALCQLMCRPWFSRRWVIQEIAFASQAVVHCGYMSVSWWQFAEAIRSLPRIWKHQAELYGASWITCTQPRTSFGGQISTDSSGYWGDPEAQSAARLLFASENVFGGIMDGSGSQTTRLYGLQTLVEEFASFDVSDPCDTIYALLPLAKDSHSWNPSYSQNVMEVYQYFISYSVEVSGSLDILLRPWARSYRDLPSWVAVNHGPKFATAVGRSLRQHAELFIGPPQSRIYNASGDLKPRINFPEFPKSRIRQLQAAGILLDTVAEERGPATAGSLIKDWPSWALEAAQRKGTDVAT